MLLYLIFKDYFTNCNMYDKKGLKP